MTEAIIDNQRRLLGMVLKEPSDGEAREIFRRLLARYPLSEWSQVSGPPHAFIARVLSEVIDAGPISWTGVDEWIVRAAVEDRGISGADVLNEVSLCRSVGCRPYREEALLYSQPLINGRLARNASFMVRRSAEMIEDQRDPIEVLGELLDDGARLIAQAERGVGAVRQEQACQETLHRLKEGWEGRGKPMVLKTQWPLLNHRLGGGWCIGMNVLASRPKVGKSSLWEQEVVHHGRRDDASVVVTLEMTRLEHLMRMAVRASGIDAPYEVVMSGKGLEADERESLEHAFKMLSKLPIHWHDLETLSAPYTWPSIRASIDDTRASAGSEVRLVVVDCLGLIEPVGRHQRQDLALGQITKSMQRWALSQGVSLILVHHLNRSLERDASTRLGKKDAKGKREPDETRFRRPRMSDLKECGQLEQDAGVILLPHRPSASGAMDPTVTPKGEECEVIVVGRKCRPGSVPMWWRGSSLSWFERIESERGFIG